MLMLSLACMAFLGTHLGISSTPLRNLVVAGMGRGGYLGMYSLVAVASIVWMVYAYAHTTHGDFIWFSGIGIVVFAKVLMPFALILVVSGLMVKNPTSVGQDEAVKVAPGGIIRITRHPVQWGILLWAIAHVMANGDQASILFFGTFAAVSALGMAAMDAKGRARRDPVWDGFMATTSYVPFVALITGRTSLKLSELNWIAVGIGAALYALIFIFHGVIAGVPLMNG